VVHPLSTLRIIFTGLLRARNLPLFRQFVRIGTRQAQAVPLESMLEQEDNARKLEQKQPASPKRDADANEDGVKEK
jgi:hypothetical protein